MGRELSRAILSILAHYTVCLDSEPAWFETIHLKLTKKYERKQKFSLTSPEVHAAQCKNLESEVVGFFRNWFW